MKSEQILLTTAIILAFFILGLVFLLLPNRIQAKTLEVNRLYRHWPILGYVGYDWVRSRQYIVFLCIAGSMVIGTALLLGYLAFLHR